MSMTFFVRKWWYFCCQLLFQNASMKLFNKADTFYSDFCINIISFVIGARQVRFQGAQNRPG